MEAEVPARLRGAEHRERDRHFEDRVLAAEAVERVNEVDLADEVATRELIQQLSRSGWTDRVQDPGRIAPHRAGRLSVRAGVRRHTSGVAIAIERVGRAVTTLSEDSHRGCATHPTTEFDAEGRSSEHIDSKVARCELLESVVGALTRHDRDIELVADPSTEVEAEVT